MSDITYDEDDGYLVKQINFGVLRVSIVLQDRDGPCPLIAIANTLLLRGSIGLPHNQPTVSHNALVRILRDYALQINRVPDDASPEVRANIKANVDASVRVLCSYKMRRGLLINPSLTSVSSFEFTPEIGVFDLFRIRTLHGWVVGPGDAPALRDFFHGRTYNQVLDALAYLQHVYDLSAGSTVTRDEEEEDDDEIRPSTIRRSPSRTGDEYGTQEQASLAMVWFAQHRSQLTHCGVGELERAVSENEIAILFRNNHFSTMICHNGKLYTLMSAAAYSECPHYVWHRVEVRGAETGTAFDGAFRPLSQSQQYATQRRVVKVTAARMRVGDEIREMKARREALRKREEESSKYVLHHHPAQRTRRSLRPAEVERRAAMTAAANYRHFGRIEEDAQWSTSQLSVSSSQHDIGSGGCALT